MDHSLYQAIKSGDINHLKQTPSNDLLLQMTPLKNTPLHLAVQFNKISCVQDICNRSPSLIWQTNSKGDTPLHLAARLGLSNIVSSLIQYGKTYEEDIEIQLEDFLEESSSVQVLIRMRNQKNDTPLHEAIRNQRFEVLKLLTEEDPIFEYLLANNEGETPLYLAAEEGLMEYVVQILQTCSTSAHIGPYGRTALHAAIVSDNSDITKLLLEKKQGIVKEADENGRTPLHYAAQLNLHKRVVQLLDFDSSIMYISDKDGKTALHIAATKSSTKLIDDLARYCPDSWELVDNNGQNFLHVVAENGRGLLMKHLLGSYEMVEGIVNEQDNNGNTPLHLAAMTGNFRVVDILNRDQRVNKRVINKNNLTAHDAFRSKINLKYTDVYLRWIMRMRGARPSKRKSIMEDQGEEMSLMNDQKDISDTHMVVATLIATITFAAGFTLPGGYRSNGNNEEGMAVLDKKPAFKVFIISDTLAMLFSTTTVLIYFMATLFPNKKLMSYFIEMAIVFTITALSFMIIAFVTGMYVVLGNAIGLSITVTLIGCSFFLSNLVLTYIAF